MVNFAHVDAGSIPESRAIGAKLADVIDVRRGPVRLAVRWGEERGELPGAEKGDDYKLGARLNQLCALIVCQHELAPNFKGLRVTRKRVFESIIPAT